MSWEQFDLKGASPNPPPLPVGEDYVWQFLGAAINEQGKLQLKISVANDNEFKGRRGDQSFPDPSVQPWVEQIVARVRDALGVHVHNGEGVIQAFNKKINTQFSAPVVSNSYVDKTTGELVENTKVNLRASKAI